MGNTTIDALRSYLLTEAKESEEYIRLVQSCQAFIPRIIFKVLLYDSILHFEIINDLILLLNSSSIEKARNECLNYIKDNIDRLKENVWKEQEALDELMTIKASEDPLFESLIRYLCNDEESHVALLKSLIKEVKDIQS